MYKIHVAQLVYVAVKRDQFNQLDKINSFVHTFVLSSLE